MILSFIHLLIHTSCLTENGHTESSQVTADTKVKSLDIKKVTSSDLKTSDESAEKVEKVSLGFIVDTRICHLVFIMFKD